MGLSEPALVTLKWVAQDAAALGLVLGVVGRHHSTS